MESQLRLLAETRSADSPKAPASWRIDDTTRAVGRTGISKARAALRRARTTSAGLDRHHPAAA